MTLDHRFGVLAGVGGLDITLCLIFLASFMGILQAKCLNYEMYDPWVGG